MNIIQKLEPRARAIGRLVGGHAWRWGGFQINDPLESGLETNDDGTQKIWWKRRSEKKALLVFNNIRPIGMTDVKVSDPVVKESKNIDASRITIRNLEGIVTQHAIYEGKFGSTKSEEDAVTAGFEVAIRNAFTAGNDATPVKNETEITATVRSEWEKRTNKGSSVEKTVTIPAECPPGYDLEVWAERDIEVLERTLRGNGDYEHTIDIGKHWHKKWSGQKTWDSFARYLRVIKGQGADNDSLGREFRNNIPFDWHVRKPLNVPFEQTYTYDNVTSTELRQRVLNKAGE